MEQFDLITNQHKLIYIRYKYKIFIIYLIFYLPCQSLTHSLFVDCNDSKNHQIQLFLLNYNY